MSPKPSSSTMRVRIKESLLSELKITRRTGERRRKSSGTSKEKLDSFMRLSILGEGAYGKVYKAKVRVAFGDFKKDELVALKEQRSSSEARKEHRLVLNFCGVNHIVQTFQSFTYKDKYYTVMELMDKDLDGHILPRGDMMGILEQIVAGLSNIHNKGIVHRDLKLENIFLRVIRKNRGRSLQVKIGDFGLALPMEDACGKAAHPLGICPEMFLHPSYVFKSDIFATGILLLQMVCYGASETEADDGATLWLDMARLYLLLITESKTDSFRICIEEMAAEIFNYFVQDNEERSKMMIIDSDKDRSELFEKIANRILKNAEADKKLSEHILNMLCFEPSRRSMPVDIYKVDINSSPIADLPEDLRTVPIVIRGGHVRRLSRKSVGSNYSSDQEAKNNRTGEINALKTLERFYTMSVSERKKSLTAESLRRSSTKAVCDVSIVIDE